MLTLRLPVITSESRVGVMSSSAANFFSRSDFNTYLTFPRTLFIERLQEIIVGK